MYSQLKTIFRLGGIQDFDIIKQFMLIFVSHKLLSKPPRTSANWERCKEVECWSKQQIYTVDLLLYLQLPPSLQLSFSLSFSAIRLPAVLNPIKTPSLDAIIYSFPQKRKKRKREKWEVELGIILDALPWPQLLQNPFCLSGFLARKASGTAVV